MKLKKKKAFNKWYDLNRVEAQRKFREDVEKKISDLMSSGVEYITAYDIYDLLGVERPRFNMIIPVNKKEEA